MLKKNLNHLKSKWYKYVLEIIVIILGILIAYNLEQWSDRRNIKKKEIGILREFKRCLSSDLEDIHGFIRLHERCVQVISATFNFCKNTVFGV